MQLIWCKPSIFRAVLATAKAQFPLDPSGGATIVSTLFRSLSQRGLASIAPPLVVAFGPDWAMSFSSGGFRKAMTALSP